MEDQINKEIKHPVNICNNNLAAVEDALYVIGGKWKLRIIIALRRGYYRFNELQRAVTGISARVLSSELKDLELIGFVKKIADTHNPIVMEYRLTGYSDTLKDVLRSLSEWGIMHRVKIKGERTNF
jgi:DNA-binding HxlR family transcriptional regulator